MPGLAKGLKVISNDHGLGQAYEHFRSAVHLWDLLFPCLCVPRLLKPKHPYPQEVGCDTDFVSVPEETCTDGKRDISAGKVIFSWHRPI